MPATGLREPMNDPVKEARRTEQRRRNVRLGLILATIAAAFFIGFIVKMRVLAG